MSELKRVLIQVDGQLGIGQPAIHRALAIADKEKTQLFLLLPVFVQTEKLSAVLDDEQCKVLQHHAAEKANAHLDLLATKLRQQGYHVETRIGWNRYSYAAVIAAAMENQVDMVVAAAKGHGMLERLLVTPEERQLLRLCPCPVWLVKNAEAEGPVVAAIDAGTGEPAHKALNHQIAHMARDMARQLGSRWLSVSAYVSPAMMYAVDVAVDLTGFDGEAMKEMRLAAQKNGEEFGLCTADIIVDQGPPTEVLIGQAKKHNASMLVIGTIARSGVNAWLMGNTAEDLIDKVGCDVLALKPAGFTCPVTFED